MHTYAHAVWHCCIAALLQNNNLYTAHTLHWHADTQHKGLFKIGFTVDVPERMKQHNYCCQASYILVKSYPDFNKMKHAQDCESRIHAVLRDKRQIITCAHTGKAHREWFKGQEKDILDTVKAEVLRWRQMYGEVKAGV